MFSELEKSLIRNINKNRVIDFTKLLNSVLLGITINYDPANSRQPQELFLNNIDEKDNKIYELLIVIYLLKSLGEDKFIYILDSDTDQTANVEIGSINRGRSPIRDSYRNIELFRDVNQFINKKIASTTKLKRLEENDFYYEPTVRFTKQMRLQFFAIGITAIIGALTLSGTVYSILNKQKIDFFLQKNSELESVINELKESNNQKKNIYGKIENIQQEIAELNKQLDQNYQDKKIHNEELVTKIVDAIEKIKK